MIRSRNITIDILKGICILLVVLGHYYPSTVADWYRDIIQIIYRFHMPAFMWVSGFLYILTLKDHESYGHFQMRKAQRLLLPYIIVSALIVTIKYLNQGAMFVESPVTIRSYLNIFYLPEAGHFMWYIWALVLIFLIVPFFRTPRSRLILLLISAIPYAVSTKLPEIFCLNQALRYLPYFALGMVSCDLTPKFAHPIRSIKKRYCVLAAAILLTTVIVLFYYCNPTENKIAEYACGIFGLSAVALLSYAYSHSALSTKFIIVIGDASFIIYLFHTTLQGFGKAVLKKLCASGITLHPLLDITIIFTATIAGTLLIYFVLKRFKATSRLFGI